MTEKITFKDMLAALPQQQDAGSIVARDANGNPIFISKADLVQVAAELMPVATAEKNGLMPKEQYMAYGNISGKSFNEVLTPGRYVFAKSDLSDISKKPKFSGYGILEVFKIPGHEYVLQRITYENPGEGESLELINRFSTDGGGEWKTLSNDSFYLGSRGLAVKAVKSDKSGREFYMRITGCNNGIKDAFLSFKNENGKISPILTNITDKSPVVHLSYKDFGDYTIIYFWHNACFITIKFEDIRRGTPECTILASESEIPEDVVLVE